MNWANEDSYVGQFRKNLIDGKGSFYWADGRVYEGEWKQN